MGDELLVTGADLMAAGPGGCALGAQLRVYIVRNGIS